MSLVKPPAPQVQAGHPLADGLEYVLAMSEGSGNPRDLILDDEAPATGSPTWTTDTPGACLEYPPTGAHYHTLPLRIARPTWTLAVLCRPATITGDHDLQPLFSTTGNYGAYLTVGLGSPALFNTSFLWLDGSGGIAANQWTMVSASGSAAGRAMYAGGVLRGSDSNHAHGFAAATGARLGYRADGGASNNQYGGRIAAVYLWERVLSPAEHASLSADWFGLITPSDATLAMAGTLGLTGAAALFAGTTPSDAVFADRPRFDKRLGCTPRFLIS